MGNLPSPSVVKSLDKLISILECFSPERSAWSLVALSNSLDIPKSSLHRYLNSLEHHGLVRRSPEDGLWRMGYRLFVWGGLVPEIASLRDIANPAVRELVEATGETAFLTVYDNQEVMCVDKVESDHAVRMNVQVGTRRYAHAGASSKVLMACRSEAEIQAILRDKGLPRVSTNTITDPDALLAELARIRGQGYAMSDGETDQGAWGVAVPVYGAGNQVIAAIGVAGPTSRYSEERAQHYVDSCRKAADKISTLLQGRTTISI